MRLAGQSLFAPDSASLDQLLPAENHTRSNGAWGTQAGSRSAREISGRSVGVPKSASAAALGSPERAKLRKAAGDFEAILLESLWKSMKETFKDPSDDSSDPTLETFDDYGMQMMASAVGSAGGLGIKNMILKYLEPRIDGNTAAGTVPAR